MQILISNSIIHSIKITAYYFGTSKLYHWVTVNWEVCGNDELACLILILAEAQEPSTNYNPEWMAFYFMIKRDCEFESLEPSYYMHPFSGAGNPMFFSTTW